MILWLWICFVGGAGALLQGEWAVGALALGAGVVTLLYASVPSDAGRWLIRAALVAAWVAGGLLLWDWAIEDWAVAARIAFVALGGGALLAYLVWGPRARTPARTGV